MAHLVRCIEGHIFDQDAHDCCPVCGAVVPKVAPPQPHDDSMVARAPSQSEEAQDKRKLAAGAKPGPAGPWLIAGFSSGVALIVLAFGIWQFVIRPRPRSAPQVQAAAANGNKPQPGKQTQGAADSQAPPTTEKTRPADQAAAKAPAPKPAPHHQEAMATNAAPPEPASAPEARVQGSHKQTQGASSPHPPHAQQPAAKSAAENTAPGPLKPAVQASAAPSTTPTLKPTEQAKKIAPPPAAQESEQTQASAQLRPAPPPASKPSSAPQSSTGATSEASRPKSASLTPLQPAQSANVTIEDASAILNKLAQHAGVKGELLTLARFAVGVALFEHGQTGLGKHLLEDAVIKGVPTAGDYIGAGYQLGKFGLPRDFKQAALWLGKAADDGNVYAAWNLIPLVIGGKGTPRDLGRAAHLLRFTYLAGLPQAVDYIDGARKGNEKNMQVLAALKIDPTRMPKTASELFYDYVKKDPKKLRRKLEAFIENKNAGAYGYLAEMVENGLGGGRDVDRARSLYLQEAAQGGLASLVFAGRSYANSAEGPPNYPAAAVCFVLARALNVTIPNSGYDPTKLLAETMPRLSPDQNGAVQALSDFLVRITKGPPQVAKKG